MVPCCWWGGTNFARVHSDAHQFAFAELFRLLHLKKARCVARVDCEKKSTTTKTTSVSQQVVSLSLFFIACLAASGLSVFSFFFFFFQLLLLLWSFVLCFRRRRFS